MRLLFLFSVLSLVCLSGCGSPSNVAIPADSIPPRPPPPAGSGKGAVSKGAAPASNTATTDAPRD